MDFPLFGLSFSDSVHPTRKWCFRHFSASVKVKWFCSTMSGAEDLVDGDAYFKFKLLGMSLERTLSIWSNECRWSCFHPWSWCYLGKSRAFLWSECGLLVKSTKQSSFPLRSFTRLGSSMSVADDSSCGASVTVHDVVCILQGLIVDVGVPISSAFTSSGPAVLSSSLRQCHFSWFMRITKYS
jgi:hypothetical protein